MTPLDPGRELAREWARHELSDPVYAKAQPGLLQRAVQWVLDRLGELRIDSSGIGSTTGLVLLVLLLALVTAVVLFRTGRLRGPARRIGPGTVFGDQTLSSAQHLALADAAAAGGQWRDAVRERFRGLIRALEEREVIDAGPGRTADEAAREAGRALPPAADSLRAAAIVFDEVCYGMRPAAAADDDLVRAALGAAVAARPQHAAPVLALGRL